MDYIGAIVNAILTAIFLFNNVNLLIGLTLVWHFVSFPMLNPAVSFPHLLTNSGAIPPLNWNYDNSSQVGGDLQASVYASYSQELMDVAVNLNIIFLNYIVTPILGIIVILVALGYLMGLFFNVRDKLNNMLPRLFIFVILAYVSVYIADLIFDIGSAFYSFVYYMNFAPSQIPGGSLQNAHLLGIGSLGAWPFGNTNWLDFLQSNGLLEFIFLFTILAMLLIVTAIIAVRLVWIFVTLILLPIGSILMIFKRTERLGIKIWGSFVERTFEIFFIAIPLIFLNYFSDPLWSIAVFTVALSMPRFVSIAGEAIGYPDSGRSLGRAIQLAELKASNVPIPFVSSMNTSNKSSSPMNLLGTIITKK